MTSLFLTAFVFLSLFAGYNDFELCESLERLEKRKPLRGKSKEFEAAGAVISLAAISDVHVNGSAEPSEKFRKALKQLKAKSETSDADGLDAVLVVGDLIDYPRQNQIDEFKAVYESVCDPVRIPMIYTVGNHDVPDYRWRSTMVRDAEYIRRALGPDYFLKDQDNEVRTKYECRHCIVGGYNILSVSPDGTQPITYNPDVISWLDAKLKLITDAEPEKYVIVLTHPMITDTVYGSLLGEAGGVWNSSSPGFWATSNLTKVLEKYPQAVVFGGHLHFPLNDPRSLWQDKFTVSGCASVRYMAIENGGYEYMHGQTTMKDRNEFSQGNLVQFDSNGNMRIYRMDFYNEAVIGGEPLTFSYPSSDLSHLKTCSHSLRAAINKAPSLSSLDIEVEPQNVAALFSAGNDDEFVHDYLLVLKKDGSVVASKKILADFYKHPMPADMKKVWRQDLGPLPDGRYEISLKAYDSWGAESNTLTKSFEIYPLNNFRVGDKDGSGVVFERKE